ncbi:MAG TPA: aminoglycoside phosphotransferase family protein, partial [Thermomicrobiales bacterium]|nr:aminoglycoside phosphotransferase family protein [Thermomicrobiales bacterium]
ANTFCNPPQQDIATLRERILRRADIIAAAARLDRDRLLRWVLAYSGLSAAWFLGDWGHGDVESASLPLRIAEIAAAELVHF